MAGEKPGVPSATTNLPSTSADTNNSILKIAASSDKMGKKRQPIDQTKNKVTFNDNMAYYLLSYK